LIAYWIKSDAQYLLPRSARGGQQTFTDFNGQRKPRARF